MVFSEAVEFRCLLITNLATGQRYEHVIETRAPQANRVDRNTEFAHEFGNECVAVLCFHPDSSINEERLKAKSLPQLLSGSLVISSSENDDISADLGFELLGSVEGNDPAMVDDRKPITLFCFLKVVGSKKKGHPSLLVKGSEVFPDLASCLRIKA